MCDQFAYFVDLQRESILIELCFHLDLLRCNGYLSMCVFYQSYFFLGNNIGLNIIYRMIYYGLLSYFGVIKSRDANRPAFAERVPLLGIMSRVPQRVLKNTLFHHAEVPHFHHGLFLAFLLEIP